MEQGKTTIHYRLGCTSSSVAQSKAYMEPDSKAAAASHKADLAFKVFDRNNDGFVTKSEVLQVSKKLTKEQVDVVFQRNDENHDGKLSREEFHGFMQKASKQ